MQVCLRLMLAQYGGGMEKGEEKAEECTHGNGIRDGGQMKEISILIMLAWREMDRLLSVKRLSWENIILS